MKHNLKNRPKYHFPLDPIIMDYEKWLEGFKKELQGELKRICTKDRCPCGHHWIDGYDYALKEILGIEQT